MNCAINFYNATLKAVFYFCKSNASNLKIDYEIVLKDILKLFGSMSGRL